jgi:serine/threonine protein kinase
MPLAPGTRVGPYEIVGPLGAGGMGEVYRAKDTKLKREVAVKVLPEVFAGDAGRMARFQREAEVLAALNHPNIAQIYGAEDNALAMELVEGPTLAERMDQGALPLDESLALALQIAEALEAAHEKGIVHRDLKPANIKIKPDGVVKVLDFGLAAILQNTASGATDPAHSPTLTMGATQAGAILGTAAYMSPEQAVGKPVDRRADIWSFGVVLFEMLTGTRLFSGETTSHILADVIKGEIDLGKLPSSTPGAIRNLIKRCLDRDVKNRLQWIGEARVTIHAAIHNPGKEMETAASAPSRSRLGSVVWALAGLALAAGFAGVGWWRATRPAERPLVRLEVDLGADVSLPISNNLTGSVSLSPDGTRLVYRSGNPTHLFTRRLDQTKATELPGTEGAVYQFFSPDGQWVGFVSGNKLYKISVEGGAVVPLADMPTFAGASWGEDGSIIVGQAVTRGMVRIPAGGGTPTPVTEFAGGEIIHADPQVLPGGKAVLFDSFGAVSDADKVNIDVVTLADRHRKTLVRGGAWPRYLPSGHLIYVNKGTLFAVPFDLNRLETRGTAVPVLDDVAYQPLTSAPAALDFSNAGTLIYRRGSAGGSSRLMTVQWVDQTGRKEPLRAKPGIYTSPRLSPDGKRLALVVTEGAGQDIWVYDPQRDAMTRLTFSGGPYAVPIWTPDGRNIVFGTIGKGLSWTRADGAGQPQPLFQTKNIQVPFSFSPDGKRLAYYEIAGPAQIWTVPVEEQGGQLTAGKPEPFLKTTQIVDVSPEFSPDGHWLAYDSDESGKQEVYVRAFPPPASGQGGKWQISNASGSDPRWLRNGRELLYRSGDQIMAVSYTVQGETFVAEKPRLWLDKLGGTQYDVAPDGKRLAVITPVASAEAPKAEHTVVFLENFFDELRRRVP